MKLSLSNWLLCSKKQPLEKSIDHIKRLGFENFEFNMKCVKEKDAKIAYTTKRFVDYYGLKCMSVHSAGLYVERDKEISELLYLVNTSADFASILSAPIMVIHSGISRKTSAPMRKELYSKIFGEIIPYAKRLNVKLALENLSLHSKGFGKSIGEIEEIFSNTGDCLGLTLDVYHSETMNQTLAFIEKFSSRIVNVHLSYKDHKAFEKPTKKLSTIIAKLQEFGYDGTLTLELDSTNTIKEVLETKQILENILKSLGLNENVVGS